ncbi:alpha/beta fold hydrolase [Myceligenerans halotolerans]
MAHEPLPSPYAALIAGTPVARSALTVRGGRTHLWRYGPDDAREHLVLLHGFRGDHHGLEPIVAHLLRVCPDLRVTVPDLPGFGASPPLPGARHDVVGYASWARALLRKLAPEGDIVLAGHSFGSVIAAATMATSSAAPASASPGPRTDAGPAGAGEPDAGQAGAGEPDVEPVRNAVTDAGHTGSDGPAASLARQLVLINPIPRRPLSGRDTFSVGATAVLHAVAGILPEETGTSLLRHRLLTRVASIAMVRTPDRALRRWIHEEHDRYFARFATRASLLESFRASITASVRDSAAAVDVPTLLVGGAKDDLARVPDQQALAAGFRDARLTLIPGVGHLTHYETPAEVATEIAVFLAEKRTPAAAV